MQMASLPEWADFLQYCGRALRARSLRFLIPPIEALKARRHLAKTSISFAGTGAKTCGLNALAHNLCLKKTKVYRIKKNAQSMSRLQRTSARLAAISTARIVFNCLNISLLSPCSRKRDNLALEHKIACARLPPPRSYQFWAPWHSANLYAN